MNRMKKIICFLIGHNWVEDFDGNDDCAEHNLTIRHCTCKRCSKKDIIDIFTYR